MTDKINKHHINFIIDVLLARANVIIIHD